MGKELKGQAELVLNKLKNGELVSSKAMFSYGITRLSAIIYVLRKIGYNIITIRKAVPTRWGIVSIAMYKLGDKK